MEGCVQGFCADLGSGGGYGVPENLLLCSTREQGRGDMYGGKVSAYASFETARRYVG